MRWCVDGLDGERITTGVVCIHGRRASSKDTDDLAHVGVACQNLHEATSIALSGSENTTSVNTEAARQEGNKHPHESNVIQVGIVGSCWTPIWVGDEATAHASNVDSDAIRIQDLVIPLNLSLNRSSVSSISVKSEHER